MNAAQYAVRRARSSEPGRWVVCTNGLPNEVRATGFLTRWGATFRAARWTKQNEKADKMYPV